MANCQIYWNANNAVFIVKRSSCDKIYIHKRENFRKVVKRQRYHLK